MELIVCQLYLNQAATKIKRERERKREKKRRGYKFQDSVRGKFMEWITKHRNELIY